MLPEHTTATRKRRILVAVHSADPHAITITPLKRTYATPWPELREKLMRRVRGA